MQENDITELTSESQSLRDNLLAIVQTTAGTFAIILGGKYFFTHFLPWLFSVVNDMFQ
jgi:hypothetical protein